MKYRGTLLAILLALTFSSISGQNNVVFTYDANGSRISRTIEIVQLKSSTVTFPVDLTKLEQINTDDPEGIQLYPNPFSSSIRLLVNGYDEIEKKRIEVYSLSGALLLKFENLSQDNELDLSRLGEGVYVMRLFFGSEIFNYKIIKRK